MNGVAAPLHGALIKSSEGRDFEDTEAFLLGNVLIVPSGSIETGKWKL